MIAVEDAPAATVDGPQDVHVTPTFEEHADSRACWCKPTVELHGAAALVTHRARNEAS